jgi:hypothetical protein
MKNILLGAMRRLNFTILELKKFSCFQFYTEEYNYLVKEDVDVYFLLSGIEQEEAKYEDADSN